MGTFLDAALDAFLPTTCAGCDGACSGGAFATWCATCSDTLPRSLWPIDPPPPQLASAWFYGAYDGPVGAAVRRAKYQPDEQALRDLGLRLALASAGRLPGVDLVVPVPPMARTALQRGVVPTAVLAHAVAHALNRPVHAILRRKSGRRQAELGREERAANVQGAFQAVRTIEATRVLLIDDVVTTGATATACARELLCAGARSVHLVAVCAARG